jgi:hypothetical protein
MRAIGIDSFLEALEESRTPGALMGVPSPTAYDWGRLVAEGKAARAAADGGKWRIGQLAMLVERKYRSRSLQRFATDIGECYATVRRYRWVVSRYDSGIRFRFPGLSFSHFQAVASLPDRVAWLGKAEKCLWSVDRLVRETRNASPAVVTTAAAIERARPQIAGLATTLAKLAAMDDETLAAAAESWLAETLDRVDAEALRLRKRIDAARTRSRSKPRSRRVAASV